MLIYKNKASKKHFLFLDDFGKDKGLFVTPPICDDKITIHPLEYELFYDDPIEIEEDDELLKGLLSNKQIEAYRVFKEKDKTRKINNVIRWAIETKDVDIELIKKEEGEEFSNLIKFLRENTKDLTADDFD